jgi:hypothetical protein
LEAIENKVVHTTSEAQSGESRQYTHGTNAGQGHSFEKVSAAARLSGTNTDTLLDYRSPMQIKLLIQDKVWWRRLPNSIRK